MKTIDTLIQDMEDVILNGPKIGYEAAQKVMAKYSVAIDNQWEASFLDERQTPRIRMSNIGKMCSREAWYNEHSEGRKIEKLSPALLHLFSYGHLVEQQALMLAELAGHKVTHRQESCEVSDVSGSCDAVIDGVVIDVKSCGDFVFQKFLNGLEPGDPFGYWVQLVGYYSDLKKKYPDEIVDNQVAWLAVDKEKGRIYLDHHIVSDKQVDDVVDYVRRRRIESRVAAPPDRMLDDEKGKSKVLPLACRFCNWKFECKNPRAFVYSSRGKETITFYTDPVGLRVDERPTNDMWEISK